MDTLTHYLAGYFIGRRGGADTDLLRATTLCAVLPDLDFIGALWGWDAMADLHRTLTHSLLGMFIIVLLVVAAMAYYRGKDAAMYALPFCFMSGISHLLLDMFCFPKSLLYVFGVPGAPAGPAYLEGIPLAWPLTDHRFSVVNQGILWLEIVGWVMIVMFCLSIVYIIRRYRKGDLVWEIWTIPIKERLQRE